jgi:hypothetical protein
MSGHQVENDVHLGRVGKALGFRVAPPTLMGSEQICWAGRANRSQNRVRYVGGRLYLTNQRLMFRCSKLESRLGGDEWEVALAELMGVEATKGRLATMTIRPRSGKVERFRVSDVDRATETIASAIDDAQRTHSRSGQ